MIRSQDKGTGTRRWQGRASGERRVSLLGMRLEEGSKRSVNEFGNWKDLDWHDCNKRARSEAESRKIFMHSHPRIPS